MAAGASYERRSCSDTLRVDACLICLISSSYEPISAADGQSAITRPTAEGSAAAMFTDRLSALPSIRIVQGKTPAAPSHPRCLQQRHRGCDDHPVDRHGQQRRGPRGLPMPVNELEHVLVGDDRGDPGQHHDAHRGRLSHETVRPLNPRHGDLLAVDRGREPSALWPGPGENRMGTAGPDRPGTDRHEAIWMALTARKNRHGSPSDVTVRWPLFGRVADS